MEKWIYRNLRKFRNTMISQKLFKKYGGTEKIIKDLDKHGLSCRITPKEAHFYMKSGTRLKNFTLTRDTWYLIEVVRR